MNTVILDVRTLKDSLADFTNALKTGANSAPRISFETPELLWQTLTIKRWEILKAMTGGGVLSIREVARRVNHDVKAVHGDVHALLNAGLLKKSGDGVTFPYDGIHVDFRLQAAA